MKRLKDLCPFMPGVAVSGRTIASERDLILREFDSVTCDNAMKLNYRVGARGGYDFA